MASKRKTKKTEDVITPVVEEEAITPVEETVVPETEKTTITTKKEEPKKVKEVKPKYPIGSIVFITKDADADLNGFKLFPQYKKYTYTVEAYDEKSDVFTLRRLNLSLRLKKEFIVAPGEKSDSPLVRKQF